MCVGARGQDAAGVIVHACEEEEWLQGFSEWGGGGDGQLQYVASAFAKGEIQ
jgi:hypothetical protein